MMFMNEEKIKLFDDTVSVSKVIWDDGTIRYHVMVAGHSIWIEKDGSIGIDPAGTCYTGHGKDTESAWDVSKYDSGGIQIVPRDKSLSTFPFIRIGDEALWELPTK